MSEIKINLENAVKKMKPMHAGGQPPVTSDSSNAYFHYLTEAGIPYSRLHDVGGAFGCGKYVDIPNIVTLTLTLTTRIATILPLQTACSVSLI